MDDVRAVLARARDRLGGNGIRTLLFIDEIHRFDKRQQDSVLHAVEDGLVTLIGATTENPYFEVNQALLSRCTVIELEPLTVEELGQVLARGADELGAAIPDKVAAEIARRAGGDARTALQTLELAWETATAAEAELSVEHVEDVARKRPLRFDRAGDRHYDLASAFIKSMRGGDPDAAVYYLAGMLEGGEDRASSHDDVIAASEDVGTPTPARCSSPSQRRRRSSTSACPRRSSTSRRPRSTSHARRSRMRPLRRSGRRGRTSGATGSAPRRRCCAMRTTAVRRIAATAPATSRRTTIRPDRPPITSPRACGAGRTMFRPRTARRRRRRRMTIGTGDKAPEFDLEESSGRPRVRLSNYLGRSNVLLVFHPFAFTPVCTEEAQDLQQNLASFRNANTEIVFVSCDSSAARQAWRRELGAEYTFASDFWSHGETAKRYGVFNEENGAPIRGTFLIDTDGVVIWSLVKETNTRRTEMVPGSLETLRADK